MLVADDEPLFVEMVEALLASDDRIEVVGLPTTGKRAVELRRHSAPDMTLMDISMPTLDGIEAGSGGSAGTTRQPRSSLTGSSISADIDRSRQAGAAGFLTKDRNR